MLHDADGERGGEAGFSLIEVLISLVLVAAVLAMLPGAFGMVQRTQRTEAVMSMHSEIAAVRDYLAQTIASAQPVLARTEGGRTGLAFRGGRDSVTFVAAEREGALGPGLYRHTLSARPSLALSAGAAVELVLTVSESPADGGEGPVLEMRTLVTATTFGLRYFGAPAPGGERGWQTDWSRTDAMPELIEVTLPGADGTPARPLIARPAIDPAR